ncbi:Lon protease family protein [Caldinitratiruptor microaerophilus]|uniref:Lon protease family protein n=1 Tax=Caldinitratiruptor microaerophilus TaxID=671077 RepID=UPI00223250D1|nr:AAA family ATPase [Caldinitratiruptor microaerophilus]
MRERLALAPEDLRRTWDPAELGFATTAELPELTGLVGQARAVKALEFGLAIKMPGYNIYVAGPPGTGKTSYTRSLVARRAEAEPPADDWVYVCNFDQPDQPQALRLPPGVGPQLARDVDEMLHDAVVAAGRALESKEHAEQREELVRRARAQMAEVVARLEATAQEQGFLITQTEQGYMPVPVLRGQALTEQEFNTLDPERRREIARRAEQMREAIAEASRQMWELEKSVQESLRTLDAAVARAAVHPVMERIKARYTGLPEVVAWLERVQEELIGGMRLGQNPGAPLPPQATEELRPGQRPDPFARFRVNVFVTRDGEKGAPVVVETNPTYTNLFGKVEYTGTGTQFQTSVTRIKAGALHRANGGYLILQAADLLQSPFAWDALKRALASREVRIEPAGQELRLVPLETLRPQPIPLNVKVILIGSAHLFHLLYAVDEGFRKLFKLKAEFDTVMPVVPETVRGYASFIAQVCRRDGLRHLDAGAVARVMEHSHRLAEDREKFSARFNELVELIYEADAWAAADGSPVVRAVHVDRAIAEKAERSALPAERTRELIERGILLVDVDGAVVGQVNGLTVMRIGDYSFGAPSRITARVYMGEKGILHIEREIQMSGQIHDKGVLTLSGYLGERFAQRRPLALSASIAFEQTYVPVDGDSASSTELYALLSALSGLPVDQGIAVTGSVNQRGQVQPIGGVNEKIEGFFQVCKVKGLTGRQGVMIPRQNLANLMLSPEVVDAVRAGQFHIWAVSTVEEGIELLTGVPAGEPLPDGGFTPGSVFDRVDRRLQELAERLAAWANPGSRVEGRRANGPAGAGSAGERAGGPA